MSGGWGFPDKVKRDKPVVKVRGNLNKAIRDLTRRLAIGGDARLLRLRAFYPKQSERRRAKAIRAASRRRRTEQRRAGWQ